MSSPLLILSLGNLVALILQIKVDPDAANFLLHLLAFISPLSQHFFTAYFASIFAMIINLIRFGFKIRERDMTLIVWLLLPLLLIWLRQNLSPGI